MESLRFSLFTILTHREKDWHVNTHTPSSRLESAPPSFPYPLPGLNHSLSLLDGSAFLSLSRNEWAIVFLMLGGSHSFVSLVLGKPLTILNITFAHFHFPTKIWTFNGKLCHTHLVFSPSFTMFEKGIHKPFPLASISLILSFDTLKGHF